jgi:hypothetical protein
MIPFMRARARGLDQCLGIGAERRIDLHRERELAVAQEPRELRLSRGGLEGRQLLALLHEEGARGTTVRVDRLADRRDLSRRGPAAAADQPRAERPRLRGELGEVGRSRVREDDPLAAHAREADVRQRCEHGSVAAHLGQRGERGGGPGAVVRAVRGEAERTQPRRRVLRLHAGERLSTGVEGEQCDERECRDGADRGDRRLQLVEVVERLEHEQVDPASLEHPRLLGAELRPVVPGELDVAERADRARDEDVPPGDLARLAGDADRGGVDLLELVGEVLARELRPVRAEGVRLDQLGARPDVTEMHLEHALGRAEVRFLGAAQPGDGAREQGAHAAVGDDRRLLGEPLLETAHASSWMVRPSIPPATVTSSPVTWPESSSEASTTTARATSSATATLRNAIVRLRRATSSSSSSPRVIGEYVQPGATALTRPRGAIRTISFLRLRSSPTWIAALAAA